MTDNDLLHFEKEAWDHGWINVAGVDEAGRGPIAGPVVAAAVILPRDCDLAGINDSKLLTSGKREEIAHKLIFTLAVNAGVGNVTAREIEKINILQATYLAMNRALADLKVEPDFVLIDGNMLPSIPYQGRTVVKGDRKSASIAAASILAKVKRDQYMMEADERFPEYGFARHKGYATAAHLEALRRLGPCPLHRKTFAPVSSLCNGAYFQPLLF